MTFFILSIISFNEYLINFIYLLLIFIFEIIYLSILISDFSGYNYKNDCNCCKKKDLIIKLIRYKNYKINDYFLPSNFESMTTQEKINCLSIYEYNFEYSLNSEQIQLIKLINKFRKKFEIGKLVYKKIEKFKDYICY